MKVTCYNHIGDLGVVSIHVLHDIDELCGIYSMIDTPNYTSPSALTALSTEVTT